MKRRYKVVSVSGFSAVGGGRGNSRWISIWYVLDRLNCHRAVYVAPINTKGGGTEARARARARELEARHRNHLRQLGLL